MTFLTLIICLVFNHYWLRRRRLSVELWFNRWYRWLEKRSARGSAPWLPHPAVFVAILSVIPLLPLAALLWLVDGLLLGLPALLIHTLVLLHAMPRTNLGQLVEDYLFRWRQGNYEAAYRYIEQREPEAFERQPSDYSCLNQQFFDFVLLNTFVRIFSLIFWYVLLGPIAALGYWALDRTRVEATDLGVKQVAHQLTGLIEWIPARLVAVGFALAGDFVAGFGKLRERLLHGPTDLATQTLLKNCALASMGQPGGAAREPEYAFRAAWDLAALHNLLLRTQAVWVIVLALLILVV